MCGDNGTRLGVWVGWSWGVLRRQVARDAPSMQRVTGAPVEPRHGVWP